MATDRGLRQNGPIPPCLVHGRLFSGPSGTYKSMFLFAKAIDTGRMFS